MQKEKICIVTVYDNNNFGNRLQNYAMQEILSNRGFEVLTLKHRIKTDTPSGIFNGWCIHILKYIQEFVRNLKIIKRYNKFKKFNKHIRFYKKYMIYNRYKSLNSKFDYFVVGSDQIWNLNTYQSKMYVNFLEFVDDNGKKIAIAPSIAINNLTNYQCDLLSNSLVSFKSLSCRENQGSEIVEQCTKKECQTIIDPTLMLPKNHWLTLICKPKFHNDDVKYILLYFLGGINMETYKYINDMAIKYNLRIINLLDKKSKYYNCGPSEFLYLINNSSMVFTDSYHATIFSYIFGKPLKIVRRIQKTFQESMYSRLENLIERLNLDNCELSFKNISDKDFSVSYDYNYLILEQKKFNDYLNKAFIN